MELGRRSQGLWVTQAACSLSTLGMLAFSASVSLHLNGGMGTCLLRLYENKLRYYIESVLEGRMGGSVS